MPSDQVSPHELLDYVRHLSPGKTDVFPDLPIGPVAISTCWAVTGQVGVFTQEAVGFFAAFGELLPAGIPLDLPRKEVPGQVPVFHC